MAVGSGHDDRGVSRALVAGIFANFAVAVVKFVAFLMTRSSAMLAESLHSVADSSNQALLLVGLKRSRRPADPLHPFGYSGERYFWAFVVSVNVFLLGSVFAIYEGIKKISHPHAMESVVWNYVAIAAGLVFEAVALRIAWREFSHWRVQTKGSLWQSLRDAKDLALPAVLFEDTAAIAGLLVAAAGITLTVLTGNGIYDGIASVLIGVILLVVAWFLASESHSLLIGEAASSRDRQRIVDVITRHAGVARLVDLKTVHMGPSNLVVALVLEFQDGLTTDEIERAIGELEDEIRQVLPTAKHIFVEAGAFRRRRPAIAPASDEHP